MKLLVSVPLSGTNCLMMAAALRTDSPITDVNMRDGLDEQVNVELGLVPKSLMDRF